MPALAELGTTVAGLGSIVVQVDDADLLIAGR
jgi:hypothetical protein